LPAAVKYYYIGAFLQPVKLKATLEPDERTRIAFLPDEVLYKMLPHPLLGCKYYVFFTDFIKQAQLPVIVAYFKRIGRKIERW
jgi:hypothetical protein